MKLNNNVYDVLKWVAMLLIPAFGTLYFTLANIWGWSYGNEVAKTCMALVTFLGAILGLSNLSYKKKRNINNWHKGGWRWQIFQPIPM